MDLANTEYGNIVQSLQQGHFALLFYWFYIIAGIMISCCILELIYRCDRKFLYMVLLCPAAVVFVIMVRFERYRALTFFLASYIILLLLADTLTVGSVEYDTLELLTIFSFWPIYAIYALIKYFNIDLYRIRNLLPF